MQKLSVPALVLSLLAVPVWGRDASSPAILMAGPGQTFELPAVAVRLARPGDTVRIVPGRYTDCLWAAGERITIEGAGPGVVFDGGICQGKAIIVVSGRDITIRNLTLANAHNAVHNGAGIRAEGVNLTVEDVRFLDNDEGILGAPRPESTVIVRHSAFQGNGNCIGACAHGLYIGTAALLRVEHSDFRGQHVGHHIKSRALRTEIVGNRVEDGSDGTSSYLIDLPSGGGALITGNRLQKGPRSENAGIAIAIGAEHEEYSNPAGAIEITGNNFINNAGRPTIFVRNFLAAPARLRANRLTGAVTPLLGQGTVE